MRPFEVNSYIGRTQDIGLIKQNQDSKPLVQQHAIAQNFEKQVDSQMEQVHHKENSEFEKPFDENGKGGASYEERERKKKEKEDEDGKVTVKTRANFDIRI